MVYMVNGIKSGKLTSMFLSFFDVKFNWNQKYGEQYNTTFGDIVFNPQIVNIKFPLVQQELLTLPEHTSSLPVFGGIRVALSLVFF